MSTTQLACSDSGSKPTPSEPTAGTSGGAGAGGANAGVAGTGLEAGTAGEVDAGAEAGTIRPASFGLLHAAEGLASLRWSLTEDKNEHEAGSLDFAHGTRVEALLPGAYTLELALGSRRITRQLELAEGAALNVVVSADATGAPNWQVHVLVVEPEPEDKPAESTDARLFVIHEGRAGELSVDVGNDDTAHPEGDLDPDSASPVWALDLTRPALAFVKEGTASATFTLPVPQERSTMLVVLLGDPAADGTSAEGQRLLVARMSSEVEVQEVRADPLFYFVQASAVHAAVDLFVARGNPISEVIGRTETAVGTPVFVRDTSANRPLKMAELADNVRFGELRAGRAPAGPATLEIFHTIAGDAQLPAPLNFSLVGDLLANQRLRNGEPIARQGGSTVGGEFLAGAEYLLTLPWSAPSDVFRSFSNRSKGQPFPIERLQRPTLPAEKLRLRVATSVKTRTTAIITSVELDGAQQVGNATKYQLGPHQLLDGGTHQLMLRIGTNSTHSLTLDTHPGQDLLVIAAGDAAPTEAVIQPTPRPDDSDGDGAVCSPLNPETQHPLDPNYLPPDGDSLLVQDDCPNEPGPLSHQGCPSVPLNWLIIDFAARPPTIRVVPME